MADGLLGHDLVDDVLVGASFGLHHLSALAPSVVEHFEYGLKAREQSASVEGERRQKVYRTTTWKTEPTNR